VPLVVLALVEEVVVLLETPFLVAILDQDHLHLLVLLFPQAAHRRPHFLT